MVLFCWTECDKKNATLGEDSGLTLAGIWTFSWLMGGLLILGLCANVFLIWMTTRHRFPVRWETFRLILRYSSVVDLSLCVVLVLVVLRSSVLSHTGSRLESSSVQCTRFDLDSLLYSGGITVASGVVVVARQTIMLVAFDQEVELMGQNRMRTVNLVKNVAVVGVVCLLATMAFSRIAPAVDQPLCYVTCTMSSRVCHLILVPVAVNILLGVFDIVSRPPSSNAEYVSLVNDSRWNRFVLSAHVAFITWFILVAAMAAAGVLMQPVSVDMFFALTSSVVLTSVWSAFAVARHWTK